MKKQRNKEANQQLHVRLANRWKVQGDLGLLPSAPKNSEILGRNQMDLQLELPFYCVHCTCTSRV